MSQLEESLLWVGFGLLLVGPAILLLLLRRWLRQWWAAILATVAVTPIAAYFGFGGLAWLLTYYRVVVHGDTSIPDRIGRTVPQYLEYTFHVCGSYAVLFSPFGAAISAFFLIMWWLAHPRSFEYLFEHRRPPDQDGGPSSERSSASSSADLGRLATEATRRMTTFRTAITTIAISTFLFAGIGIGIGWMLGTYLPGYYRGVFRDGNQPWFDPVSVGVGLGFGQGFAGGVAVGLVLVAIFAWRDSRLHRPAVVQGPSETSPSDALDRGGSTAFHA